LGIPTLSDESSRFLMEAAKQYRNDVSGSRAEEYLRTRGFGREELWGAAQRFRLGFVANPLPGHEKYRGRLAIPYLRQGPDGSWSTATIRFRKIGDGPGPKYLSPPADQPRLFNTIEIARNHEWIAITEGELDAIAATTSGVPAVGIPGATLVQPHFVELFRGYRIVYILTDGDSAGEEFGATLKKSLPNGRVIAMDDGEDVDSMVLKYGKDILKERVGL